MLDMLSEKKEPSALVSIVEIEDGQPKLSRRQLYRKNIVSILRRSLDRRSKTEESPWPKIIRNFVYVFGAAVILGAVTVIIYHSLMLDLVRTLSPLKMPDNGLTKIVAEWVEPGTNISPPPLWLPDFSRDVIPKPIHSHNDYWRRVPLLESLSLGVTGIEADCYLKNGELYIGHKPRSLRTSRTLNSLYLDPLKIILENQNAKNVLDNSTTINGVWDTNPSSTIVLMTDLKTEGYTTLEAVQAKLKPFREKGWLTYWNGTNVVPGPITHVGTGNTPFAAVLNSTFANSTYRDVFFDAPLDALTNDYNVSNSYYASTSMSRQFHWILPGGLSKNNMITVQGQIDKAKSQGLVSRYWDTPGWPSSRRMNVWGQLVNAGVGMLNVDEIYEASRWNWKWCGVLGLHLC